MKYRKMPKTGDELSVLGYGCRYCLPCPAWIDIPLASQAYNNYRMFGKLHTKMLYAVRPASSFRMNKFFKMPYCFSNILFL